MKFINVKQFKKKFVYSLIEPELFYLPIDDNKKTLNIVTAFYNYYDVELKQHYTVDTEAQSPAYTQIVIRNKNGRIIYVSDKSDFYTNYSVQLKPSIYYISVIGVKNGLIPDYTYQVDLIDNVTNLKIDIEYKWIFCTTEIENGSCEVYLENVNYHYISNFFNPEDYHYNKEYTTTVNFTDFKVNNYVKGFNIRDDKTNINIGFIPYRNLFVHCGGDVSNFIPPKERMGSSVISLAISTKLLINYSYSYYGENIYAKYDNDFGENPENRRFLVDNYNIDVNINTPEFPTQLAPESPEETGLGTQNILPVVNARYSEQKIINHNFLEFYQKYMNLRFMGTINKEEFNTLINWNKGDYYAAGEEIIFETIVIPFGSYIIMKTIYTEGVPLDITDFENVTLSSLGVFYITQKAEIYSILNSDTYFDNPLYPDIFNNYSGSIKGVTNRLTSRLSSWVLNQMEYFNVLKEIKDAINYYVNYSESTFSIINENYFNANNSIIALINSGGQYEGFYRYNKFDTYTDYLNSQNKIVNQTKMQLFNIDEYHIQDSLVNSIISSDTSFQMVTLVGNENNFCIYPFEFISSTAYTNYNDLDAYVDNFHMIAKDFISYSDDYDEY